MGRRLSAEAILVAIGGVLLALVLATVPAAAHHKDEHLNGGGKGAAAAQDEADQGDNAHPSGKDRSVENGGSGNQGNSESDPDDDGRGPDRSNGGPDKPNGSGGVDKADQDGNNGCGNDDDFEDDNEGWCGRKPKTKPASSTGEAPGEGDTGVLPAGPCVDESGMAADEDECDDAGVLGGVIARPATAAVDVPTIPDEPEVLGERLAQGQPVEGGPPQRGASFLGQTLPFTGSALTSYAAIAVGLLLAGAGILTTRKRT